MKVIYMLYIQLFWLATVAADGTASTAVVVRCSDSNASSYPSGCWEQGTSVVCDSLEYGLREAGRLGATMVVENTTHCTDQLKCEMLNFNHMEDPKLVRHRKAYASKVLPKKSCPLGFISGYMEGNQSQCKCIEGIGHRIRCTTVKGTEVAFVRHGFCMTYYAATGITSISNCFFSCQVHGSLLDGATDFDLLPENFSLLEEVQCGRLNRQGYMCSECRPGYEIPVNSYSPMCIPCNLTKMELTFRWIEYLAITIIPQSVLFFLMAIFRIGITRPPFISMIYVFQAMSTPMYLQSVTRLFTCWTNTSIEKDRVLIIFNIFITFCGFFNLDFFRVLIPPRCLKLDFAKLVLLEYASAFWPLILIFGAYLSIELHSRGFKPVIWIWKPAHYCFHRWNWEWKWGSRSSLVETFASFLLLSWVKLLSTSFSLLKAVCVYTVSSAGEVSVDCTHLYYSLDMKLFKEKHLHLGILAISILIIFVAVPLVLLVLYPLEQFHRLLNWCGLHSQALHIFMDSFQGSLRDRTDGTIDRRYFASSYLIARVLLILLASVIISRYFFPVASVVMMVFAMAVGLIRPYKKSHHNTFELIMLVNLAAFFASNGAVTVAQFAAVDGYVMLSVVFTGITAMLPVVISICYGVWWIVQVKRSRIHLCSHIKQWWQRRDRVVESLPDRINNPQDYHEMDLVAIHCE